MNKVLFRGGNVNKNRQRNNANSLQLVRFFTGLLKVAGLLAISGFMLFQIYRSLTTTQKKLDIFEQAETDLDALRLKNLELILEGEAVKTDDYIETEGRDRLNLSKKGETLFIIPESVLKSRELDEYYKSITSEPSKYLPDKKGLEGWADFMLKGV